MINEIDKTFARATIARSKLSTSKELNNVTWFAGQTVICLLPDEIFDGDIIGFYSNSALVKHPKRISRHCVSFRNLLDPATNKPLRATGSNDKVTADIVEKNVNL